MSTILNTTKVLELLPYHFYIPSYQRGYRWTTREVTTLIEDIHLFRSIQAGNGENTWYCLQPLILRPDGDRYEVIDGQQRLTTIYLLLHYFNSRLIEDSREPIFSIEYASRPKSGEFLRNIHAHDDPNELPNIDFYHIASAYNSIRRWFQQRQGEIDLNEFQSKLKSFTKVIWYETDEDDPIDLFTRINIGKIPLSSSDLIKALFLNKSNFTEALEVDETFLSKQITVANEWDRMEHALQHDSFWYFLTDKRVTYNRIELIFDLLNDEFEEDEDALSTFHFFNSRVIDRESFQKEWRSVKTMFQQLQEWFEDRVLYHKIGYILARGMKSLKALTKEASNIGKKEFLSRLDQIITTHFEDLILEDLEYSDSNKVRDVLLLYNIMTMLDNDKDASRFPFNYYKKGSWDIEHITSVSDEPIGKLDKNQWIEDVLPFIEDDRNGDNNDTETLKSELRNFNIEASSDDEFENLYRRVINYFNSNITDTDLNDISNLALLDSKTNRGYKNAVFPIKRKTIIQRERAGAFIPLGTKNVFLKYFSEYPPKISLWSQEDRENYMMDLCDRLSPYINSGSNE